MTSWYSVLVGGAVQVEDDVHGQVVALAAGVIVRVVRRRDLHGAGTEVHVHEHVVEDDGDQLAVERVLHEAAVEVRVARVLRVHGHGGVAEHGLEARRGHDDLLVGGVAVGVGHLVREARERAELVLVAVGVPRHGAEGAALDVLGLDLDLGDGRAQRAAPVHEARAAVEDAGLVEAHEGLRDGAAEVGVHGEGLARPVHGAAQEAQLRRDAVAVLLLPGPDAAQELLAPEVVPRDALLLHELLLHHGLRRDAGVVRAGDVQRHVAAHAVPAREAVLDGRRQRVPEVQAARHVRRRDHHDELPLVRHALGVRRVRGVVPRGLPPILPCGLDGQGLVAREHLRAHVLLLALGRRVHELDALGVVLLLLLLALALRRPPVRVLHLLPPLALGAALQLLLAQLLLAAVGGRAGQVHPGVHRHAHVHLVLLPQVRGARGTVHGAAHGCRLSPRRVARCRSAASEGAGAGGLGWG
mmetsp:Transcript_40371/g.126313  ORF Transcript_40371/g.126313 Transcript_40371/m.126313 type:complete len:470 (-) Transcript_40371:49-1458(-)